MKRYDLAKITHTKNKNVLLVTNATFFEINRIFQNKHTLQTLQTVQTLQPLQTLQELHKCMHTCIHNIA